MAFFQDVADFARSVKGMTRDVNLHKAADKLIESAERESDAAYEVLERVKTPASEPIDIHSPSTTVPMLRDEAKRLGVTLKSSWKKPQIIEALEAEAK